MSRITDRRSRFTSLARRCRPWVEWLEDRWVPSSAGTIAALTSAGNNPTGATLLPALATGKPPVIDPVADQTLARGDTLHVQVIGHNTGGNEDHYYRLLVAPVGSHINHQTGEVTWTPSEDQHNGAYLFWADVETDSGFATESFVVYYSAPRGNLTPLGSEFTLATNWQDTGFDGASVTINYGDGSPEEKFLPDFPGDFTLQHLYEKPGKYTVSITGRDGDNMPDEDDENTWTMRVNVVGTFVSRSAGPGETTTANVTSDDQHASVAALFKHADGSRGPATVFVAIYKEPPVETERKGLFFDVLVNDRVEGDQVTVTVTHELLKGAFNFGYFTETNQWVSLLNNPSLAVVRVNAKDGTMTVTFKVSNIFGGTVFTVSLPPSGDTTSGTISPPTAKVDTNTNTNTDSSSGQTRTLSFTSNAQLALALTASRDNQLSVSSTGRGSQAGESGGVANSGALTAGKLSSTAGVGADGEHRKSEEPLKDDSASFWRWLQSDEGLMQLWLNGIDPSILMQLGVSAELSDVQPWHASVFETPMVDLPVEGRLSEMEHLATEEGEPVDLSSVSFAMLPVLFSGLAQQRSRRKVCG